MRKNNQKNACGKVCIGAGAVLFLMGGQAFAAQTICTPLWVSSAGSYASVEAANTAVLQAAIKSCSSAGTASLPGLVDLKASGSVTTAQISSVALGSNIVFKVESGFTLQGPNPADVSYTGTGSGTPAPIISGSGLSNVTITGTGTIDGNGAGFWTLFNKGGSYMNQARPKLIQISGSGLAIGANFSDAGKNVSGVSFPTSSNDTTKTLKIKNSPKEQLAIESGASNVLIDGVWIYAPTGRATLGTGSKKNVAPNTDGIDIIGTSTAVVQNCVIDTGDDDVAIKSNAGSKTTKGVTVQNCVFGGGHGLSIGGQEASGVSNVTASNVWFSGTDYGFKIKTDNTSKDSGTTNTVTYQNSCLLNVGEPLLFTYDYNGTASGGTSPTIENVTVDNVIATAATTAGQSAILGAVTGLTDDLMTNNIKVINSKITGSGATNFTVTYGTLILGSKSTMATTLGTKGTVSSVTDTGPTVSCPTSVVIPTQE